MARLIDKETSYRIKIHKNGRYLYASTQPIVSGQDSTSGRKKHKRIHWGTLDSNMKFHPNNNYIMASPEERDKLIFPEDWDMSEANSLPSERKAGRPASSQTEEQNLLYGDIWLLEQAAEKTGLKDDLVRVFNGNKEMADAILSIAMYQVSNGGSFNRIAHWQRIEKTPYTRPITAPFITKLTQSITEENRMSMFRLRAARVKDGDLCAVDSTSRSAYGNSLADIKWGKNKERLPLEQTNEVVVYDLSTHMPIYYRTFPGNIPDSRTIETILTELKHAGFPSLVLITDRGYESVRNLERYILDGQKLIMWVRVKQTMVMSRILEFGNFSHCPEGMEVDEDSRLYHKQYDLDYKVDVRQGCSKSSDRLKLNLYFDPVRRSEQLMQLDIDIKKQRDALLKLQAESYPMDDDDTLKRCYNYFDIKLNEDSRTIESFDINKKKVDDAKLTSGFYANVTHAIDYTAIQASQSYALRDEQEKYFEQEKGPIGANRQRCWSEDGKNGRLFIYFVAMTLASYVKHVWNKTDLKKQFCSFTEMLDEMRPIRCVEHKGRAKHITPFVGKQLDIVKAFAFEIPEGCDAKYKSKKSHEKRVGRPAKPKVFPE
jgi:transposase